MKKVLVVGASGQTGTAVTRRLLARGVAVRTLVRSEQQFARFRDLGAEPCRGDLTHPPSLESACEEIDVVVTTANAAVPTRPSDKFEAVERDGYRNLIGAAVKADVRRFVYTSAPVSERALISPFVRYKRETEEFLQKSGLDYVIFRADIFMDVAFAMMGSAIPLRSAEGATALRPFAFANRHFARIRNDIEQKGVASIPGDGTARHTFICVDDVAEFLTAAAGGGPSGVFSIGGPEALTFLDVVRIYEKLLGKQLKVRKAPSVVLRIAAAVLAPFSPAASNLMVLNYSAATEDTICDPDAAELFGVRLTSAETFLRTRAAAAAAG